MRVTPERTALAIATALNVAFPGANPTLRLLCTVGLFALYIGGSIAVRIAKIKHGSKPK